FERAILELVPDARARPGLLAVQLLGIGHVVSPEIDQLACRIDFRLKHGLRLPEHRRGIHRRPPRRGEQLRRFQQNGGAIFELPARPLLARGERGLDGHLHVLRLGHVVVGEHVLVLERHYGLTGLARPDFLAADDERDLDALLRHRREPRLELGFLRRTGRVRANGLVHRGRDTTDGVPGGNLRHEQSSSGKQPRILSYLTGPYNGRRSCKSAKHATVRSPCFSSAAVLLSTTSPACCAKPLQARSRAARGTCSWICRACTTSTARVSARSFPRMSPSPGEVDVCDSSAHPIGSRSCSLSPASKECSSASRRRKKRRCSCPDAGATAPAYCAAAAGCREPSSRSTSRRDAGSWPTIRSLATISRTVFSSSTCSVMNHCNSAIAAKTFSLNASS